MKSALFKPRAWYGWLGAGLVLLTAFLGFLQYRWIGEVSAAQRDRLRSSLQASLHRLSQDFNAEITSLGTTLVSAGREQDAPERQRRYGQAFLEWREASRHGKIAGRLGLVVRDRDRLTLSLFREDTGALEPTDWPETWKDWPRRHAERIGLPPLGEPLEPRSAPRVTLVDFARLDLRPPERGGPPPGGPKGSSSAVPGPGRPPEGPGGPPEPRRPLVSEWILVELDTREIRERVLPELLVRHLGAEGSKEYYAEVRDRDAPGELIFRSDPSSPPGRETTVDASTSLLEVQMEVILRRAGVMGMGRGGPRLRPAAALDRGEWVMTLQHKAGSLEAVIEATRKKNLLVTTAVMLLMLGAVGALVWSTRRAQHLARLQMDFVAGVSHELRTPLTVIRTAAHNLSGGLVKDGEQVQRYGGLIREESQRLTEIVEQVLRFARAESGQGLGAKERVSVESLVLDAVAASKGFLDNSACRVDTHVEPETPEVIVDAASMRHALQNLLSNAAKYAASGGWIGVNARVTHDGEEEVEIRVEDHGPGIPREELAHLFEPFYRGSKAMEEQIHGTGLGLSLVARIVEANGGTVEAESEPGNGARFTIRLPGAPRMNGNESTPD